MQLKVGDRVRVRAFIGIRPELHELEGIVSSVEKHTVCVILPNHRVVGYKSDFPWEFDPLNMEEKFTIISGTSSAIASTTSRQEKPCRVCNRNNDVGVKVCWCCGNAPH